MGMNWLYKDDKETSRGGVNKILIDEIKKWGLVASVPGHRGIQPGAAGNLSVHPEYFKKILFDLFDHYEIDYQLYSPIVNVVKEGKTVTGVVVGAKEGNKTIKGKVIIDATGDGDIAWLAGCQMMASGEEKTGWRAPVTVSFAVGNVDTDKFFKWLLGEGYANLNHKRYRKEIHPQGIAKGYNLPGWEDFHKTTVPGVVSINNGTSQDLSVDPSNSYSLTYIEKLILDEALEFIRWVRTEKLIPGMEDAYLMRTGGCAMARDTRRLVGEYVYTNEDVMNGTEFPDKVASKYGSSDPIGELRPQHMPIKAGGAGYPYRSYLPKEVDGLLVAGRCASATFTGNYGGKSIGNMLCLGQAAGVAGALCSKMNIQPRALDAKLIQKKLDEMGVSL
jgi:hypothetical protein